MLNASWNPLANSARALFDAACGSDRSEASSYEEWKARAIEHDRRKGLDRWKEDDSSDLYDYKIIRRRCDELIDVRASGDPHRLLYYLNEGLHGNMGGMGAPLLYAEAKFGTKRLITDYVNEMVGALEDFERADEGQIDRATKLAYFRRAAGCFGRSALMFSGAGSLGAFHIGVARALATENVLPSVVSGASAGSLVAAMIGTHPPEHLPEGLAKVAPLPQQLNSGRSSAFAPRTVLRQSEVQEMIEAAVPDLTFLEAFEATGVALNISVAPEKLHQRSRLLNAVTSPNALVREAVLASCAVPGVLPPVALAARDRHGRRQPYVPSRRWIDGSITDDLPAQRLSRLYGVNHFIASQINPIVFWSLTDPISENTLLGRLTSVYQSAARDWTRALYPFVMDAVRNAYPVNVYMRFLFGLATQSYTADINILPTQRYFDPTRLLSPLTAEEAASLIAEGERATWPKVEMIRNCTKVSRCIDGVLQRMEAA